MYTSIYYSQIHKQIKLLYFENGWVKIESDERFISKYYIAELEILRNYLTKFEYELIGNFKD